MKNNVKHILNCKISKLKCQKGPSRYISILKIHIGSNDPLEIFSTITNAILFLFHSSLPHLGK